MAEVLEMVKAAGRAATKRKPSIKPGDPIPPPPVGHRGSKLWLDRDPDAARARAMHARGWTIQDLARQYNTTWHTMARIVKGLSWKHVT